MNNTSDLPPCDHDECPKDRCIQKKVTIGWRSLARILTRSADALDSLQAQLAGAQNRIEALVNACSSQSIADDLELKEVIAAKDAEIERLNKRCASFDEKEKLLKECIATLWKWQAYSQRDIETNKEQMEASGEAFTEVWFDTKQLLARAAELGGRKEKQ